MSDGVVLMADQWVPFGSDDPPVVLVQCPYGRGVFGLRYGRAFARRGFRVVLVSCRGTGGSGGRFDQPFLLEHDDGQDIVEWLREQPWFTGKFATIGGSYLGYMQLALAMKPPPELAAMVLQTTPLSGYRNWYTNGALDLWTFLSAASDVLPKPEATFGALWRMVVHHRRKVRVADMAPLLSNYQRATMGRVGFFEDGITEEDPADGYWQARDAALGLQQAQVPVLVQGAWYDLFVEDSVTQFQTIRDRGLPARLTMGPWTHASFALGGKTLGAEAAEWMMKALSDGHEPTCDTPVRVQVLGTTEWREFSDWPPPGAEPLEWFLHPAGSLLQDVPGPSQPDRYLYDPADPTPHVGGAFLGLGAGATDNRKLESRRDVLTYTTPALESDLDVAGSAEVEVWFESSLEHTDVFVRLCDVHPDGRSVNISDQIVRLSPAVAPRPSDGVWRLTIALPSTACRFAKGHRIRLQVSSGAHPRFMRNTGSGEPLATATTFVVALQAVHHDSVKPSVLRLPILPRQR